MPANAELYLFLVRKYGNPVRAWRVLATCDRGKIGCEGVPCHLKLSFGDWCEALRRIGYEGDLRQTCPGNSMSLEKLDKSSFKKIQKFQKTAKWDQIYAISTFQDTQRITKMRFIQLLTSWNTGIGDTAKKKIKHQEYAAKFFNLICSLEDREHLTINDIKFCQQFTKVAEVKPNPNMSVGLKMTKSYLNLKSEVKVQLQEIKDNEMLIREDEKDIWFTQLEAFREWCKQKFESLELMWGKNLMRGNYDPGLDYQEFKKRLEKLGYDGSLMKISDIWNRLVPNPSRKGVLMTEDLFLKEEPKMLLAFKKCILERYGTFQRWFQAADPKRRLKLSRKRFVEEAISMSFPENPNPLFTMLEKENSGYITLDQIDEQTIVSLYGRKRLDTVIENRRRLVLEEDSSFNRSQIQHGRQDLVKFIALHYGTTIQAWRHMDPEGVGELDLDAFSKGLRKIGFAGHAPQIWSEFPRSVVTVDDINPRAWKTCVMFLKTVKATFRQGLPKCYNSMVKVAKNFGIVGTGVPRDIFVHVSRQHLKFNRGDVVFSYLIRDDPNMLSFVDLLNIERIAADKGFKQLLMEQARAKQNKSPRTSLLQERTQHIQKLEDRVILPVKVDFKTQFLRMITKKYGSAIRGFRLGFDPGGTKLITYQDFVRQCAFLNVRHVDQVWKELDKKDTGVISILDFDPDAEKEPNVFKEMIRQRFGPNWFEDLTAPGNPWKYPATLSLLDFRTLCAEIGYVGNPMKLFAYYDTHSEDKISFFEIDPEAAATVHRKGHKVKLPSMPDELKNTPNDGTVVPDGDGDLEKIPSTSSTLEKAQPSKWSIAKSLAEAREMKNSFVKLLIKKHGSCTIAWTSCFNKSASGKIKQQKFLEGCQKLRYKGDANNLWAAIQQLSLSKTKKKIGLRDLDARIFQDLEYFKSCLEKRFGSVWNAFYSTKALQRRHYTQKEFKELLYDIEYQRNPRVVLDLLLPAASGIQEQEISMARIDGEALKKAEKMVQWNNLDEKERQKIELEKLAKCQKKSGKSTPETKSRSLTAQESKSSKSTPGTQSNKTGTPEKPATPEGEDGVPQAKLVIPAGMTISGGTSVVLPPPSACVDNFAKYLTRRFGSTSRAWFSIMDPQGHWSVGKNQFISGVRATGWTGPCMEVWRQMEPIATFDKVDPEGFKLLREFQQACIKQFGNTKIVFEQNLDQEKLLAVCMHLKINADIGSLFALLNVHGVEGPYLPTTNSQWLDKWVKKAARPPKLKKEKKIVVQEIKKGIPVLKSEWNFSHYVTKPDKLMSLLYEANHIHLQGKVHFMKRVQKKIENETVEQWLIRYHREKQMETELAQELEKDRLAELHRKQKEEAKKVVLNDDDF